jgi:hypothetical protein
MEKSAPSFRAKRLASKWLGKAMFTLFAGNVVAPQLKMKPYDKPLYKNAQCTRQTRLFAHERKPVVHSTICETMVASGPAHNDRRGGTGNPSHHGMLRGSSRFGPTK